ncbi:MAG: PRC-barrel domain-containing protein, partial [Spirochaetota bacterium]
ASALTEFSVVSTTGEDLGMITGLRLDMVDSSVGFVVVELPGSVFGGAEFPLPVSAMSWQPAERTVTVDATLDRIEQAPGYDGVPDAPGYGFIDEMEAYWASGE